VIDQHTALVVIDLQHGVVGLPGVPNSTADVIARAVDLADAFRAAGAPVVLVRVTGPGTDRPAGWDELVPELGEHPDDVRVTKHTWGAFHATDLDLQLRRRGVTDIVLTGVATSIGVESTARAAYEHGYRVTVVADAVTDLDQDAHRNSIEWIFPRLGEVTTVDALLSRTPA